MFEVGFSELLLISVIALVVLGPERLPKLVAQVGRWVGSVSLCRLARWGRADKRRRPQA